VSSRDRAVVAIGGNSLITDPPTSRSRTSSRRPGDRPPHRRARRRGARRHRRARQRPAGRLHPAALRAGRHELHEVPSTCASPTPRARSATSSSRASVERPARAGHRPRRRLGGHPGRGRPGRPGVRAPDQADRAFMDAARRGRRAPRRGRLGRREDAEPRVAAGGRLAPPTPDRRDRRHPPPASTAASSSSPSAGAASRWSPTTPATCAGSPAVIDKDHAGGAARDARSAPTADHQHRGRAGRARLRHPEQRVGRPPHPRRGAHLPRRGHATSPRGAWRRRSRRRRLPRGRRRGGDHHHPAAARGASPAGRHPHHPMTVTRTVRCR
jgi:hypothetical protein